MEFLQPFLRESIPYRDIVDAQIVRAHEKSVAVKLVGIIPGIQENCIDTSNP